MAKHLKLNLLFVNRQMIKEGSYEFRTKTLFYETTGQNG